MEYNTIIIIGSQWGDEGKGKISNWLSLKANLVIRYQGGNNAGHSIVIGNQKHTLQHLPSGVLNPKIQNILAQGMVINPKELLNEIKTLNQAGIITTNILISNKAHVIMPYHIEQDIAIENIKSSTLNAHSIGTTKKGIGPCYEDKYSRIGIRFCDFINPQRFKRNLAKTLIVKNKVLSSLGAKTFEVKTLWDEYKEYAKVLKNYVINTQEFMEKSILKNQKIIFEGAQGALLCIEHGSYPYVTSSSPSASAVPLLTGLSFKYFKKVIGVMKSYTTRVGNGAFPSEIKKNEIEEYIRKTGNEFGTNTGRPRRIGWLDIIALKHAIKTSGITEFAITLLDVLDQIKKIKIAHKYFLYNKEIFDIPASIEEFEKVQVKYITLEGWQKNTANARNWQDLPKNAQIYIKTIENLTGIKVSICSVGPEQNQTFLMEYTND